MKCRYCGTPIEFLYGEEENKVMAEIGACFDCKFWLDILTDYSCMQNLNMLPNKDILGIWVTPNYEIYYANKYTTDKGMKGFGGRVLQATLQDGTKQLSNNVWHRGKLPSHFREVIDFNVRKLEILA